MPQLKASSTVVRCFVWALVVTTVDKKHQEEGVTTMRVGYTGTQEEAREARKAALYNELQVRPGTPLPHLSHDVFLVRK